MFADALKTATAFTRPLVTSMRFFDQSVETSIGALVVLNDQGWIATAAHLWQPSRKYEEDRTALQEYERQRGAIEGQTSLDAKRKVTKIARLKSDPKWLTDLSYWPGRDDVRLVDVAAHFELDLAIGRLEPFDPSWVDVYPRFKDPAQGLDVGTSLCRLGFPFHGISANFDESTSTFRFAPGSIPLPFFPLEGIYTRTAMAGRTTDGQFEIKFLETSSPGLRGQSGGPILDRHGVVWAIQSRTAHLDLGFSPTIRRDGRTVEEHQFLNVGWGVHPDVILAVLKDKGVAVSLS
jgi:Trypsin-like peptidase domain